MKFKESWNNFWAYIVFCLQSGYVILKLHIIPVNYCKILTNVVHSVDLMSTSCNYLTRNSSHNNALDKKIDKQILYNNKVIKLKSFY